MSVTISMQSHRTGMDAWGCPPNSFKYLLLGFIEIPEYMSYLLQT
jgi:hypothetical protein